MLCVLLILACVRAQTPSSLLGPRHFNYHPYVRQYLEETVSPTKNGPVLFPNSSPAPPTPIPRPLGSIGENTSLPSSSHISSVFQPYLRRVPQYQPFVPVPYGQKPDYEEYEERPKLPPIYKVLSDHANQNLQKVVKTSTHRPKKEDYYNYNDVSGERAEDELNKNYAFSYTVKDHKTGDDFSHRQQSSGSATNGEYRVRLPDGRTQIVSYTADENGYKADVKYDTEVSDIDNDKNRNNNAYNNKFDNNNAFAGNNLDNPYAHKLTNNGFDNTYIDNKFAGNNLDNNPYAQKLTKHTHNGFTNTYLDNNVFTNNYDNAFTNKLDNSKAYTHNSIDNTNNYNDYKSREIPIKEENNDYYNDYSTEYKDKDYKIPNYQPPKAFVSTVRPAYEEIKDLFTVTPKPMYAKDVVVIGNRYTDVRSTIPPSFQNPTPYFVPDITPKPILSQSYINRINKYLTFNK